MDKKLSAYIAELVCVFGFVLVSSGVCTQLPVNEKGIPRSTENEKGILRGADPWAMVAAALAAGAALAVVLPIAYYVSPGCLNPAVTLALWMCKRLDTQRMGILIAMQLLGSFLAGLAIRAIFPEKEMFITMPAATPHVGNWLLAQTGNGVAAILLTGIAVEALLTFFLTFAIFGWLIDRRTRWFGGALVGVAQLAVVLVGYNLTGGSANPARWFGPFVWQFSVEQLRTESWAYQYDHPVYWVGPILGAAAAGLLYTTFLLPPDQAKGEAP